MTLVGIGHVARTGKDTAANALSRDLGFKRVAFADKLKELALKADPIVTPSPQTTNIGAGRGRLSWVVQGVGGWEEAKNVYPEVRKFLQNLGLGARELFGQDFWVQQALQTKYGIDIDIVVSDVRFLSEAHAVKEAGGYLIRIDRPGHSAHGHVSETELVDFEGWDAIIKNEGSVQDLEDDVIRIVTAWKRADDKAAAA